MLLDYLTKYGNTKHHTAFKLKDAIFGFSVSAVSAEAQVM